MITLFLVALQVHAGGKIQEEQKKEIALPEKITFEWIQEHRNWFDEHATRCPKGEPGKQGTLDYKGPPEAVSTER